MRIRTTAEPMDAITNNIPPATAKGLVVFLVVRLGVEELEALLDEIPATVAKLFELR